MQSKDVKKSRKEKKGERDREEKEKGQVDGKLIFNKKQEKENRIGRGKTDLQRKQEKEEREGKELKWKREKRMESYGRKRKKCIQNCLQNHLYFQII